MVAGEPTPHIPNEGLSGMEFPRIKLSRKRFFGELVALARQERVTPFEHSVKDLAADSLMSEDLFRGLTCLEMSQK